MMTPAFFCPLSFIVLRDESVRVYNVKTYLSTNKIPMAYLSHHRALIFGGQRANIHAGLSRSKVWDSIWFDERNTMFARLMPYAYLSIGSKERLFVKKSFPNIADFDV